MNPQPPSYGPRPGAPKPTPELTRTPRATPDELFELVKLLASLYDNEEPEP